MSKLILSLSKETAKEIIEFAKTIKKLKPSVNTIAFNIFSLQNKTIVLHSNGVFQAPNENLREISKCFSCKGIKYSENLPFEPDSQDYEINIDNFIINIKEEDGVYTLPINQGFELSKLELEELKDSSVINLNIAKLNSISKFTVKDAFRPAMQCVNIEILNHKMDMCATDSHVLVYINNKVEDPDLSLLIPTNVIELFNKFKIKNDLFKINIYKNYVSMHGSNMQIIYYIEDGIKFPNFHAVIPSLEEDYSDILLPIGKIKQLLPSIKNILSVKGNDSMFAIKESKYIATYTNDDGDKIEIELGNVDYGTSPIYHHFDLKYIYNVFNYIVSCNKFDEPKLHVNTVRVNRGMVITFSNELILIMPINVN